MNFIEKQREESRKKYLQARSQKQLEILNQKINDARLLELDGKLSENEKKEIEYEKSILQMASTLTQDDNIQGYNLEIQQKQAQGNTIKERLNNISQIYAGDDINDETGMKQSTWEESRIKSALTDEVRPIFSLIPKVEQERTSIKTDEKQQELPIASFKKELLEAVNKYPILIVVGETGSGKTTQIPQYLLERGKDQRIVCTQPHRVAAISVAARVANERRVELGFEVGYSVRFEDRTNEYTQITYMTDGHLFMEIIQDPLLSKYTSIMIDEAHERTISTDLLLALLKDLVLVRPEVRLIISSATLDADKMSKYFNDAPILFVPGRRFSVDIMFNMTPSPDYLEICFETALEIHRRKPIKQPCDILVFLTGQDEIDECVTRFTQLNNSKGIPPVEALPLYSSLPSDRQARVFAPVPPGTRKIIFSTNIAETSVTIDSIKYVVDSGFVKQVTYDPKTGCEALETIPISVSSAEQRAGRAGRTSNGICYRMYPETTYNQMEKTSKPEFLRCNFSPTLLMLLSMGIRDIIHFDFLDSPPAQLIQEAYKTLYLLLAANYQGDITEFGQKMSQLPVSPYAARAIIESWNLKCPISVITICSILEAGSPLFYVNRKDENSKNSSETTLRGFWDHEGDHIMMLNVYRQWEQANYSKQWCIENYVQFRTLNKAKSIREQLLAICTLLGFENETEDEDVTVISKAFAYGFFLNYAQLCNGYYETIKGQLKVDMHPSSCLKHDIPMACVFYELAKTSENIFMRTVIRVDPSWIVEAQPHLYLLQKGPNPKVILK